MWQILCQFILCHEKFGIILVLVISQLLAPSVNIIIIKASANNEQRLNEETEIHPNLQQYPRGFLSTGPGYLPVVLKLMP